MWCKEFLTGRQYTDVKLAFECYRNNYVDMYTAVSSMVVLHIQRFKSMHANVKK